MSNSTYFYKKYKIYSNEKEQIFIIYKCIKYIS